MRRFLKRFLNHLVSTHAFSKATSLGSMVERAKHTGLEEFQDTTPQSRMNI